MHDVDYGHNFRHVSKSLINDPSSLPVGILSIKLKVKVGDSTEFAWEFRNSHSHAEHIFGENVIDRT